MSVELVAAGNNLVQNIYVCLGNALEASRLGGDYGTEWEKAMQYQVELLRVINQLKYAGHLKPKIKNET